MAKGMRNGNTATTSTAGTPRNLEPKAKWLRETTRETWAITNE
jgi:hypothetical protein